MSWNGKKFESPRPTLNEIAKYISNNTSLTTAQVKECFYAYASMVYDIFTDSHVDEDTEIIFPHLGKFGLRKYTGRKNGTKYKIPNLYGGEPIEKIAIDEPSYFMIKFISSPKLREDIKKETSWIEQD